MCDQSIEVRLAPHRYDCLMPMPNFPALSGRVERASLGARPSPMRRHMGLGFRRTTAQTSFNSSAARVAALRVLTPSLG